MRGRQQYYLTIGCASNWPGLAPHPRWDMPNFRGQEWAGWGYVQRSGWRGTCPVVGGSSEGHAHFWRPGVGWLGLCPALEGAVGHVRWWEGSEGHAHFWRAGVEVGQGVAGRCGLAGAMSSPRGRCGACQVVRRGQRGACPSLAGRNGDGAGHRGQAWAGWGHVQPSRGLWGMSSGGRGRRGACPFLAGRSGLFGAMSSPRTGRGACPAEEPQAGAGRLNWAKLESSGILVSAFDSEATGEFA